MFEQRAGRDLKEPTDDACPIPATHRRIEDVHRLWHDAAVHYGEPEGFRLYLNCAIEALRNVTWILQSEKRVIPDFEAWYAERQERMQRDPVMVWLRDARTAIVKKGDLATNSHAHASILTWDEMPIAEAMLDPLTPTREFAKWIADGLATAMPAVLRADAVLVVERRWQVAELEGWELLDALAYGYGYLAEVVREAHQRCGATMAAVACTPSGPVTISTEHIGGRLPCMVATREMRSVRMSLADGGVYSTEVTAKEYPSEEQLAAAGRRYKLRAPTEQANELFTLAKGLTETAKQMLAKDKALQPTVFLLRGMEFVQVSAVQFRDRQEKFLVWQRIADDVERHGADGLIFIAEAWFAPAAALLGRDQVSEAPERQEIIHVVAAKASGGVYSSAVFFSRGLFNRIRFGETVEMEHVGLGFLDPVRQAWIRLGSCAPRPEGR
jgi:hypothetical protein